MANGVAACSEEVRIYSIAIRDFTFEPTELCDRGGLAAQVRYNNALLQRSSFNPASAHAKDIDLVSPHYASA